MKKDLIFARAMKEFKYNNSGRYYFNCFESLQLEQTRIFAAQFNCCKNLYHQSQRENMNITVGSYLINFLLYLCDACVAS